MNSPAIRFAGFTEDWEGRSIDECFTERNERSEFGDLISVTMNFGVIKAEHLRRHDTSSDDKSNYKKVEVGDIAYNSMRMWQGASGHSQYSGILSPAYTVITPQEGTHSPFFAYLFKRPSMIQLFQINSQGLTSDTWNLKWPKLRSISVIVPEFKEQQHLSELFATIDSFITLHQCKHDKTVNIKKALLEKMFPKDGEDKPEIRFAGFTDVWEPRKLGELALSFEYGLNAAATAFDGIHKYIRITDIDDETHEFKFDSLTTPDVNLRLADSYLLKDGDVLFARTGASVGKTYQYMEHDGLVYFAGFLIRARINPKYDSEFVFQNTLTRKYNSFIATTSQRSGQPGVNAVEYADYEILVPKLDEQKAIGIFLSNLDHLITLHKRELTKLQNIKKALLEKMFV